MISYVKSKLVLKINNKGANIKRAKLMGEDKLCLTALVFVLNAVDVDLINPINY